MKAVIIYACDGIDAGYILKEKDMSLASIGSEGNVEAFSSMDDLIERLRNNEESYFKSA